MQRIVTHIRKLCRDERGVTAIEYSIIAGVIGLAIIPAINATGSGVQQVYQGLIADFAAVSKGP